MLCDINQFFCYIRFWGQDPQLFEAVFRCTVSPLPALALSSLSQSNEITGSDFFHCHLFYELSGDTPDRFSASLCNHKFALLKNRKAENLIEFYHSGIGSFGKL